MLFRKIAMTIKEKKYADLRSYLHLDDLSKNMTASYKKINLIDSERF